MPDEGNVGVCNAFILAPCLQFKVIFQEFIFRKQVTNLFTRRYSFGRYTQDVNDVITRPDQVSREEA